MLAFGQRHSNGGQFQWRNEEKWTEEMISAQHLEIPHHLVTQELSSSFLRSKGVVSVAVPGLFPVNLEC